MEVIRTQRKNALGWLSASVRRIFDLRRKLATGALGVVALWLFVHVLISQNGIIMYNAKKTEYRRLQQQISSLQDENRTLAEHNKALKANDPKLVEKEAREQLRYAKPGEVVYVMPEPPAAQQSTGTATAEKKP